MSISDGIEALNSVMKPKVVENAVKLAGECLAPGASLLLDGKIVEGSAHLVIGLWSKAALGPAAMGLVIANSYATSVTGKSLIKHLAGIDGLRSTGADPSAEGEAAAEPQKGGAGGENE